ncbi:MAG TPA: hypothetical protein VK872_04475 [Draconibacterium sp.]|nr:hypothetical protein [Draconibacterium sp.]
MKAKINIIYLLLAFFILVFTGCKENDEDDGLVPTVYYSEWITPSTWLGESGDWYFSADAPELTADIVEGGVILAYASLDGDIYEAAVRPLPAYAVNANWSFLIPDYEIIEFTSDMISQPVTTGNYFRFVAISGNTEILKSASMGKMNEKVLRSMTYKEVCKLFKIPE